MTLRSGNKNIPEDAIMARIKDNQNLVEYKILPVAAPYS
jgi:hypothetical protein